MDLSFIATMGVIFVIAAVGALLKTLALDKCLKDFDDYTVTLVEKDGKQVWGIFMPYSTGFELFYDQPYQDEQGHIESSYIIYKEQFSTVHALFRYPTELSAENRTRRLADLRATYKPSIFRRLWRKTRNILNNLRDAFMQAVGLALGQMKSSTPGAVISKTEKQITALSQDVIGYAGNAYDPILERHINQRVVLEITKDGQTREFAGLLKEYSSGFLEILDISYVRNFTVDLMTIENVRNRDPLLDDLTFSIADKKVSIQNPTTQPVKLKKLAHDGGETELNRDIPPDEAAQFELPLSDSTQLTLHLDLAIVVDMIVPRTHALIRHSAEELYRGRPKAGKSALERLLEKLEREENQ